MEQVITKLVDDFVDGKMTRRQLIQKLAFAAAAATTAAGQAPVEAAAPVTAIAINHLSCQVADYAKSRDFYMGLIGLTVNPGSDNPKSKEVELTFQDDPARGIFLARHRDKNWVGGVTPNGQVDHISYTIANWDTDPNVKAALEEELKRRGLKRIANGNAGFVAGTYWEGPTGGHSFHLLDPDGLEIQLGGKIQ